MRDRRFLSIATVCGVVCLTFGAACTQSFKDKGEVVLPVGQPWTGRVELYSRENRLVVALDSNLDRDGLDGKADALFLSVLSENHAFSLPASIPSGVLLLDKARLTLNVSQADPAGEKLALELAIRPIQAAAKNGQSGSSTDPREIDGLMIPVRGIFYVLGDEEATLREAAEDLLDRLKEGDLFVPSPDLPCQAGGPGAVTASAGAGKGLHYGALCGAGSYPCCPGAPGKWCRCVNSGSSR